MAHHPLPAPASCAAQALQVTAELAMAARHGAIGAGTVLAYTARMQKLLCTLAAYEEALDHETEEARELEHTRRAALAAGTITALPIRRRHASTGGTAA